MSPRDFFKIVIKVLALLVIVNGIVPAIANVFPWFGSEMSSGLILLGLVLLFSALVYIMLVYSDTIVSFFGLDKGFDSEKFDFSKMEKSYILELGAVIIGLSLVFNSLPTLLYDVFAYFRSEVQNYSALEPLYNNEYFLYQNIISIIVGIALISARKLVTKLFD
ncbi:hypothetical protein [Winogradskyella tangerina]|uniref:hypothetical protein n=1 Tax=Winogradskyella tangerina TaxID=2023240 RepID=UPI000DBE5A6D|nr:hypothetical protein [Winogradskyella tangerina]